MDTGKVDSVAAKGVGSHMQYSVNPVAKHTVRYYPIASQVLKHDCLGR